MREQRKADLLNSFPPLTDSIRESMAGKGAQNFAVFLTYGNELYVRCYHRYSRGEIAERQRYVFARDGAVRYGTDGKGKFSVRKEFREPVFCLNNYGYSFDNSYTILNFSAVGESCMKYSQAEKFTGRCLMEYLKLYCRHPNVEYLVKQGYAGLITERYSGYWGGRVELAADSRIDWKSNNLLKMLGLNRTEFGLLKGHENMYTDYMDWREIYPQLKPQELFTLAKIVGASHGELDTICRFTRLKPMKILRYLKKQGIDSRTYMDYLHQCRRLNYDTADGAVNRPKNFHAKHDELSAIERAVEEERMANKRAVQNEQIKQLAAERKKLEFSFGGLVLIQPKSVQEIVSEGAALSHCVAGYAERHAQGALTIMFLRRADKPDEPYYTVEVTKDLHIGQCRGYKNNVTSRGGKPKTQEIIDFETAYSEYLKRLRVQQENRRKTGGKQHE